MGYADGINTLNNRAEMYQEAVALVDTRFNDLAYDSTDKIMIQSVLDEEENPTGSFKLVTWDVATGDVKKDASGNNLESGPISGDLAKMIQKNFNHYETTGAGFGETADSDNEISKGEWTSGTSAVRKENKMNSTAMQFFIDIIDKLTSMVETAAK